MSLYHRHRSFMLARLDLASVLGDSLYHEDRHGGRQDKRPDQADGNREVGVGVENRGREPSRKAGPETRRWLDLVARAQQVNAPGDDFMISGAPGAVGEVYDEPPPHLLVGDGLISEIGVPKQEFGTTHGLQLGWLARVLPLAPSDVPAPNGCLAGVPGGGQGKLPAPAPGSSVE